MTPSLETGTLSPTLVSPKRLEKSTEKNGSSLHRIEGSPARNKRSPRNQPASTLDRQKNPIRLGKGTSPTRSVGRDQTKTTSRTEHISGETLRHPMEQAANIRKQVLVMSVLSKAHFRDCIDSIDVHTGRRVSFSCPLDYHWDD